MFPLCTAVRFVLQLAPASDPVQSSLTFLVISQFSSQHANLTRHHHSPLMKGSPPVLDIIVNRAVASSNATHQRVPIFSDPSLQHFLDRLA